MIKSYISSYIAPILDDKRFTMILLARSQETMQTSTHCVHHLNSLGSNPPKPLIGIEKIFYMRGLTSYRVFIYTPEYRVSIILLWTSCFAEGKKGSVKGLNSGSYYRKACALPILTSHMHMNVHIARIPEYTCTGSRQITPLIDVHDHK